MSNVNAKVQAALKKDRKRQAEIRELGEKFGFPEEAEAYANGDYSVEDFQAYILEKSPEDLREALQMAPAQQEAESEEAVSTIKERRKERFGA